MLYTVQSHEGEEETTRQTIADCKKFEIQEDLQFGAFQVEGPTNSIQELQSMDGVYAANREGQIEFGSE